GRVRLLVPPSELVAAVSRTCGFAVDCADDGAHVAVCAGALRPRVVVSRGLLARLTPEQLDAVLLHEQHHARRRDALRQAALRAARDVFFYAPLVSWWVDRHLERAELYADRAAVQRLG